MVSRVELSSDEQGINETCPAAPAYRETAAPADETAMIPFADVSGDPEPCTAPGSGNSLLLYIRIFNNRCRRNYDWFQWGPPGRNAPLRMYWGR